MSVDPYAPPKSVALGTETTTYLDQDGYAFNNELVANKHFKSPLICAKLGIPIPPEAKPIAKEITIKRVPRFSPFIINLTSLISFFILILCFFYMDPVNIFPAIIIYTIAASILKRLTSKPYQIPFYFSARYTHIRKIRVLIFSIITFILGATISYGIFTRNGEAIAVSILAGIITFIIYKFKMTYFVVTETKGEFHYIRGAHHDLLNALPYLPISR